MRQVNASQNNLVSSAGQVTLEQRARLLGQYPITLWLTGLSAAGKSTLAYALEHRFIHDGRACTVLDGDHLRKGLNVDLGFSPQDRTENIRRVAEVAKLMNDAGLIVIASFISPYRVDREHAKQIIGAERWLEIYLSTPLVVCEARDPKGLYKKARHGDLPAFTGVSAPYEIPESPSLELDTQKISVATCVEAVIALLAQKKEAS